MRNRESKHWVSRTWLVIVNILLLAFGITVLWMGASSYRVLSENNFDGSTDEGLVMVSKNVVLGVAITGGFIMMTALAGCTGAIGRINPLLSFYVGGLVLCWLLLLGFGIFFIKGYLNNHDAWAKLSQSEWGALPDLSKDYFQYTFDCCGFQQGVLVYQGDPLYLINGRSTNNCASSSYASTAPGCYDTIVSGTDSAYRHAIGLVVGGSALMILSIGAALFSRRQMFQGKPRTVGGPVPSNVPYQQLTPQQRELQGNA